MSYRVLVIEGNEANLELMAYLLRAFGHMVIAASDGESGVDYALRTAPDLILCALALPKLDGFGVLRGLREEPSLNGVPLIAVTAAAMAGDRDRAIAAGFDGYITIPITPETFVAEVEGFLHPEARHGHDPRRR